MQVAGKNRETGELTYQKELIPKHGTRAEFMDALSRMYAEYAPHIRRGAWSRQTSRLHEHHKTATQQTRIADFAAQMPLDRIATPTCAYPERINNCVVVCGHQPYNFTFTDRKGKAVTVRKQHADVWFGFSPPGRKPDAVYWNTVANDITSWYKDGKVCTCAYEPSQQLTTLCCICFRFCMANGF